MFPAFIELLIFFGCCLLCCCNEDNAKIYFTNSWAVHIEKGDNEIANEIAEKHGFKNVGQVRITISTYIVFK